MNKYLQQHIQKEVSGLLGKAVTLEPVVSVSGGDINQAYTVRFNDGSRFFLKVNRADRLKMFQTEFAGLQAMAATDSIRVPQPLKTGSHGSDAYLLMEYLDLSARPDSQTLGRQLAAMHRKSKPQFGWQQDNFIGSTEQQNKRMDSWPDFWWQQRLLPQLQWAEARGAGSSLRRTGERLAARLPELLGHEPTASLVHGDLWGGNVAAIAGGTPVVYDPAVYCADREVDLAMTELFGSLPADFYASYQEAWPLPPGYASRKVVYNIYHMLNHYNLFGGGYAAQAEQMMRRLL